MTINQEALEEVRTAVAAVRDPEYPDLNIEQLGILEDVVRGNRAVLQLTGLDTGSHQ